VKSAKLRIHIDSNYVK